MGKLPVLVSALLLSFIYAQAEIINTRSLLGRGYRFGRYTYYKDDLMTWDQAFVVCALQGSHLAIVDSPGEEKTLGNIVNKVGLPTGIPHPTVNIGFHDRNRDGIFETIFGDDLYTPYHSFQGGQPDNFAGPEDCGSIILPSGKLNDIRCSIKNPFICERYGYVPESLVGHVYATS